MTSSQFLKNAQNTGLVRIENGEVHYLQASQAFPLTPEEQIRLETYLKLVYKYQYPPQQIAFEYSVKMGSSYKRVDLAVMKDTFSQIPLIVVECKRAGISENTFEEAIEQAFSYDAIVEASYIWVTSGERNDYFKTKHTPTGRKRYKLFGLPKYSLQNEIFFRIQEVFARLLAVVFDVYEEFLKPFLQKKWLSRWLLHSFVFLLAGYLFSIANAVWLTPYVLQKTDLMKKTITFKHLYWITMFFSVITTLWIFRRDIIPDTLITASKPAEKSKQYNNWLLFNTFLILIAGIWLTGLWFDYNKNFCYNCYKCDDDWACWWSFKHFKSYEQSDRYLEYFVPFGTTFWALSGSVAVLNNALRWYAKIR